jgi:hypothetical protein
MNKFTLIKRQHNLNRNRLIQHSQPYNNAELVLGSVEGMMTKCSYQSQTENAWTFHEVFLMVFVPFPSNQQYA